MAKAPKPKKPAVAKKAAAKKLKKPVTDKKEKKAPEKKGVEIIKEAMRRLPRHERSELISKYATVMHEVKQSTYARGMKAFAKGKSLSAMSQEDLYEALDDILLTTKREVHAWVFQDDVGKIADQCMEIVHTKSPDISDHDKMEAFLLDGAIGGKFLLYYLQELAHSGELPADKEDIERLKSIAEGFENVLKLAKQTLLTKTANRIKKTLCDFDKAELAEYLKGAQENIEKYFAKIEKIDKTLKKHKKKK